MQNKLGILKLAFRYITDWKKEKKNPKIFRREWLILARWFGLNLSSPYSFNMGKYNTLHVNSLQYMYDLIFSIECFLNQWNISIITCMRLKCKPKHINCQCILIFNFSPFSEELCLPFYWIFKVGTVNAHVTAKF
jgi:hypothetical protein